MKKFRLGLVTVVLILLLASTIVLAEEVNLRIYHTNDTHGRIEEGKYAGMGFAKIKSLIDKGKKEVDRVIYLDAGDTFHGQVITNLNEGEAAAHLLNIMGCEAMVMGNHDFNFGQKRIKELSGIVDFPLLAANLNNEDGSDSSLLENYIIREYGGVKVGIFGLATPETAYKTHPKNVKGLIFSDPVKTAEHMVNELEEKADIIIALSHLGISEGSEYTSKKVAKEVSGIDVIIDGHSHHELKNGLMINDTLIAMAYEYDKALGVVDLTVDGDRLVSKKASLITKKQAADVEKDPVVLKVVEGINNANNTITSVVVGKAAVKLNGEREEIRTGETNLGNMIADAMRWKLGTDIAITNGGGIRASIDKGEITKGEVITVLPFGNVGIAKKITGKQVWSAIEHGVSKYPAHEGLFPQISGLTFTFDATKPAGERVQSIKINGQPIDLEKTYTVATNDFMAAGGDGYGILKDAATVQEASGLEEIVIEYIKDNSPVKPDTDGRIKVVE